MSKWVKAFGDFCKGAALSFAIGEMIKTTCGDLKRDWSKFENNPYEDWRMSYLRRS